MKQIRWYWLREKGGGKGWDRKLMMTMIRETHKFVVSGWLVGVTSSPNALETQSRSEPLASSFPSQHFPSVTQAQTGFEFLLIYSSRCLAFRLQRMLASFCCWLPSVCSTFSICKSKFDVRSSGDEFSLPLEQFLRSRWNCNFRSSFPLHNPS